MYAIRSYYEGASIAYTLEDSPNPRWELYTGPIILTGGHVQIRAIAVRIGYKDSDISEAIFNVQ